MRIFFFTFISLLLSGFAFADSITFDNSDGDNDGDSDTNWVGDTKPGAGDVAVFDGATTDANCTFSEAFSVQKVLIEADYDGTVDFGDAAIGWGTGGIEAENGNGASVTMTSDKTTCSGDIDLQNLGGSFTNSSGELELGTTGITIKMLAGNEWYDFTIPTSTAAITSQTNFKVTNTFDVTGTLTIGSGTTVDVEDGQLTINSVGLIDGVGTLRMDGCGSGNGLIDNSGTVSVSNLVARNCTSGFVLDAGDYSSSDTTFNQCVWVPSSGSYTFKSLKLQANTSPTTVTNSNGATITSTGAFTVDLNGAEDISVDLSGAAGTLTLQGNIVDEETGAGSFSVTAGTAANDVILSGTSAQSCDFMADKGATWAAVQINKTSETATLTAGLSCESFLSSGAGHFNDGGETITTIGNFTWSGAGNMTLSGTPSIGGSAALTGGTGQLTVSPGAEAYTPAGNYAASLFKVYLASGTASWEFASGTYTFNGDFERESDGTALTIDNSVNDPDFVFKGSFIKSANSGTITWTKGATETHTHN